MSKKVDKKKCVFPVGERYFTTYFNAQIIGRNEEPEEGVPGRFLISSCMRKNPFNCSNSERKQFKQLRALHTPPLRTLTRTREVYANKIKDRIVNQREFKSGAGQVIFVHPILRGGWFM